MLEFYILGLFLKSKVKWVWWIGLGGGTTAFLGTFINFNILGLTVNWVWVDGGLGVEPSGAVSGEAAPATKHSAYHNTQMFPSISSFHNFQSVLGSKFHNFHFRSKSGWLTQTQSYPIFSFSPCESCALSPFLVTHTALWSPMPCSVNMNQGNCAGLSTYLTRVTSYSSWSLINTHWNCYHPPCRVIKQF